ncbi:MAG: hypothetical protein IJL12_04105 [Selenomonadaceae bacterium]|nr:hypothetical protein [Selenomonadaceae bacterium]
MSRRVLLIEPNYKNKYIPANLMKLATYFRQVCKDDVRFFKGDLKTFAAQLLLEEFFGGKVDKQNLFAPEENDAAQKFGRHAEIFLEFIKTGKSSLIEILRAENYFYEHTLKNLHRRFKAEDFPTFDIICVNSLFTFYFDETVRTINYAKKFLARDGKIFVGGVAATLVPKFFEEETGITPHIGLLDKPDDLGKNDDVIIDTLPPDYSILDEIDYKYPAADAYLTYTTRGCIRKCSFCAVSKLEPDYKDHVKIFEQLKHTEEQFGARRNLLLMDNNVLASRKFDEIIDEIKACGFGKGATYQPPDEYSVAIKNLRGGFNDRACLRKMIRLYDELERRLPENLAGNFYAQREEKFLLSVAGASKEKIFELDDFVRPLFEKYFRRKSLVRYVDFNQGLDARLIDEHKMARLAELNIRPMRIAFDHIEQREIYERAIRLAAKYGIDDLSNYLLYNFLDTPADLYNRLKINIELCEELDVAIYSFPMKYCPIDDPKYFRNRDYVGRHWNKKFIRAIQAIINATKGKVGRGRDFFEKAFGRNLDEFRELLYMPETFIIYRMKYEDNHMTESWREKFLALNVDERAEAENFIEQNKFADKDIAGVSAEVRGLLKFYQIRR